MARHEKRRVTRQGCGRVRKDSERHDAIWRLHSPHEPDTANYARMTCELSHDVWAVAVPAALSLTLPIIVKAFTPWEEKRNSDPYAR